jgi:hypothetical protein
LYYRIRADNSAEALQRNIDQADKSVTYNLLMKNPVPFYGSPIAFQGRIDQIQEIPVQDGTLTVAFVWWKRDYIKVAAGTATPFVKGDRVLVVGYVAKHLYSYKSIAQWDMAVPVIIARAIVKPGVRSRRKAFKP